MIFLFLSLGGCFFCCDRIIIHSFLFFGGRWLGKFAFLDNGRAVNFFPSLFLFG